MKKINLIQLKGCPIFKQLQLEEALLRENQENYCLVNAGSSQEAIVMGISSKVEDHLDLERVKKSRVPVIKRFSGGGTVYVDSHTLFVTFILNKDALNISPFPEPILKWGEQFYTDIFKHENFKLKENDYVLGDKKIGGNAKYIRKDRWLLHTSFLWDYSEEKMHLLQNPAKAPDYRKKRSHEAFLTPLKNHYPSLNALLERIQPSLKQHFDLQKIYQEYPEDFLELEHRKSTQFISL